jgi:O-antigen/teichoic acid export membrane protein
MTLKPAKTTDNIRSRKNIVFGTILGYVSILLGVASGLVYTPWIIQSIGKESYGLYTLSSSLIGLFLVDFGLSSAVGTFLSNFRAKNENEKIEHFLGVTYKIYLLLDVVLLIVFIIAYFLIDSVYVGLSVDERASLKTIFLISASFSLVSFPATSFTGVLTAYEQFIVLKLIDILGKLLFVAFTSVAIVFGYGLLALVLANSISNLACILAKYLFIRFHLHLKGEIKAKFSKEELKTLLSFSLWSAVASICSRLVFNVTPSILGIVSDSKNIAVFGIVTTLEGYVYTFGSVLNGFFLPKISRLKNGKSSEESRALVDDLAIKIGKIQFVFIALLEIGFFCCGEDFILLWMKGDSTYLPAYWGTLMVIFYQLIFIPELIFQTEMYAENKVKHIALCSVLKALFNLALSFPLSYFYGALGACIAITIARFIELISYNIYFHKDLGVELRPFFRGVYIRPLASCVVSIICGSLLHFYLPLAGIKKLLVEIAVISVIYLLTAFFFSFSKKEKEDFRKVFLSRKHSQELEENAK